MKHWWCAECQAEVGLSKHGRCAICNSEAVDLLATNDELSRPVSAVLTNSDEARGCS
jgi:hypothetical protein